MSTKRTPVTLTSPSALPGSIAAQVTAPDGRDAVRVVPVAARSMFSAPSPAAVSVAVHDGPRTVRTTPVALEIPVCVLHQRALVEPEERSRAAIDEEEACTRRVLTECWAMVCQPGAKFRRTDDEGRRPSAAFQKAEESSSGLRLRRTQIFQTEDVSTSLWRRLRYRRFSPSFLSECNSALLGLTDERMSSLILQGQISDLLQLAEGLFPLDAALVSGVHHILGLATRHAVFGCDVLFQLYMEDPHCDLSALQPLVVALVKSRAADEESCRVVCCFYDTLSAASSSFCEAKQLHAEMIALLCYFGAQISTSCGAEVRSGQIERVVRTLRSVAPRIPCGFLRLEDEMSVLHLLAAMEMHAVQLTAKLSSDVVQSVTALLQSTVNVRN